MEVVVLRISTSVNIGIIVVIFALMVPYIATLAILLFSNLNYAPAPGAVPAEALGNVKYEVRYKLGGISSKVADVSISLEDGLFDGQSVLHSHAAIRANSVFRLFMNAEYIADAYFTKNSQDPIYSVNPIKKGKKEGKFECVYDSASNTIRSDFTNPPAEPVLSTFKLDGLTMDLLSLLQYVRFHDIPAGKSLSVHLLMRGKSEAALLSSQGVDKEKYPGKDAEKLYLKIIDTGLMENGSGSEITVWRSTDSSHQILGLETSLSSGSMSVSIKD